MASDQRRVDSILNQFALKAGHAILGARLAPSVAPRQPPREGVEPNRWVRPLSHVPGLKKGTASPPLPKFKRTTIDHHGPVYLSDRVLFEDPLSIFRSAKRPRRRARRPRATLGRRARVWARARTRRRKGEGEGQGEAAGSRGGNAPADPSSPPPLPPSRAPRPPPPSPPDYPAWKDVPSPAQSSL